MYEELMSLKNLLDKELITQEEYDLMKKELLKSWKTNIQSADQEGTALSTENHLNKISQPTVNSQTSSCKEAKVEDNVSGGLVFLAVLAPLFGWIYWGVMKREKPNTAKACGIAAIISFVVWPIIMLCIFNIACSCLYSLN